MLWTFLNNLFVWYLQTDQIIRVQMNQTMVSRNQMFKQIKKDKSKALLFNKNNQLHKDWTRQDGMTGSSSAEVDLGCVTFHRFNTIHAMLLWWFKQYTVANKNKKRKKKSGSAHRSRADTSKLHKIFLLLHSALLAYQVEHYVQLQARIK